MIPAIAIILCCQLAGEVLARLSGLPLPGPVAGMLLLLGLLLLRERLKAVLPGALRSGDIEQVSGLLLANLSLLFVPAGVGVIQRLDILGRYWVALTLALVVSSVLGLLAAAYVFRLVDRFCGTDKR